VAVVVITFNYQSVLVIVDRFVFLIVLCGRSFTVPLLYVRAGIRSLQIVLKLANRLVRVINCIPSRNGLHPIRADCFTVWSAVEPCVLGNLVIKPPKCRDVVQVVLRY